MDIRITGASQNTLRHINLKLPAGLCSEESAREPTCVRQLLGTHGVSLRVCGAADVSQGP